MTDFNLKTIQSLDHKSKKIVANFADSEVKKETITINLVPIPNHFLFWWRRD